jgi:alanine racemase
MRPTWVDIDLEAVVHNISVMRDLVSPAAVCAVVKADAYGHGDVPVAEAALNAGASWLAVALVSEAARLREAGIDAPILLLSEPPVESAPAILQWDLVPTVYSRPMIEALAAIATTPIPVHLKVDTGMHRLGSSAADAIEFAHLISESPGLDLAAIWTHFAVADEDAEFTHLQIESFEKVLTSLRSANIHVPMAHAANTAGAIGFPEARYDMVRVGIGTYGLQPASSVGADLGLRPVMKVVSEVAHLRDHPAGSRPSYGRRRPLPADGRVASVPIGYADGLPRSLSSVAEVLIRGKRYRLAGTVTMDYIVVDIGTDTIEIGDEVVLIGRQGEEEIAVEEWADHLGTINYEIVCQIGPRMPRRYRP